MATLERRAALALCAALLGIGCSGSSIVGNTGRNDAASDADATLTDVTDVTVDAALTDVTDAADITDATDTPAADVDDASDADVTDAGSGRCRDNTDCGSNEFGFRVCDTASGRCVQCLAGTSGACLAGQYCTAANRCEDGCGADADCASDAGTFHCDVARHLCVGCTGDAQCAPGMVCQGMLCTPGCNDAHACPTGEACCSGGCRATQSDNSNCGACGRTCAPPNAMSTCVAGACAVTGCSAGYGDCDMAAANGCETSLTASLRNCGACGTVCAGAANATATCEVGRCGFTCNAGFGDCDGDPSNGCEANLDTTSSACGMCGRACPAAPNATAACASGRCGILCNTGFGDCNGVAADGCEANLAADVTHCGTCTTTCSGGTNASATCAAGRCGIACAPGFANCDGSSTNGCEADLSGTASCGACGTVCSGGTPLCAAAGASFACSSGCAGTQTRCGSTCADTTSDAND